MTKRASSVASNYDPELFLQFLCDFGERYANSYRAACNAEHRYQTGKLPAHYPVPARMTDALTASSHTNAKAFIIECLCDMGL